MAGKSIKFLEKSSVKLNFSKKLMTPYGGFALVAKLFEKLELEEHIEKIFPVVETSPNGTRIYAKVLRLGLTPRAVLDKFRTVQMVDVHLPITDGRKLILPRYTQPDKDLQLLLHHLKLQLSDQPLPKIIQNSSVLNRDGTAVVVKTF